MHISEHKPSSKNSNNFNSSIIKATNPMANPSLARVTKVNPWLVVRPVIKAAMATISRSQPVLIPLILTLPPLDNQQARE